VVLFSTLVDHTFGGHSAHLHHELKLLLFVVSWEYWFPGIQLGKDAPQTPDVNLLVILNSQNNLWRSVKPRLYVSVDLFISEASGAEVDDL